MCVQLQMLYRCDVHGSFVCSLRFDGRSTVTSCSSSSSLPPPPPHTWARRTGRSNWPVRVLVKVVQLVHAVAAKVLVERRPRSSRHRLHGGLGRGDRCVFLAHVKKLVCSLVHLLLTDACRIRQLSLNTAWVNIAKQAFGRQHLQQHASHTATVTYSVQWMLIGLLSFILPAACVHSYNTLLQLQNNTSWYPVYADK